MSADSQSIDKMIADLEAAGWINRSFTVWESPSGKLYRGPAGAWKVMRWVKEQRKARRER